MRHNKSNHGKKSSSWLNIGEVARRSGVTASALRFYESRGLISSVRGKGNQRRFHRAMLRRISIVKVAQSLGLSLKEIEEALAALPDKRTPTLRDWQKLSTRWKTRLNQRIEGLVLLREKLDGCIGCGCLSMDRCALYNPEDCAADKGAGPRYLDPAEVQDSG